MEEEERAAQSAKLQELIRRGGPDDLQEANRLMKVMAGYDTKHKTDYRAKAAEEVGKVQQKAKILEEMLQGYQQGDVIKEGDVFQELANALQSAQPKIQKMCEEESDDSEAVGKLLEINDSIHRTVERYKLIRAGDLAAAAKIPRGTLGTSTGVGKTADNELSLIDFGGDEGGGDAAAAGPAATTQGGGAAGTGGTDSIEDDLMGLSIDSTYGQGGGIALGLGNATAGPAQWAGPAAQPAAFSAVASQSPSPAPSTAFSQQPQSAQQQLQQLQQPQQQPAPAPQQAALDPFASIASIGQRQPSPSSLQPLQSAGRPLVAAQTSATADNDEWTFASSLPESSSEIVVAQDTVDIVLAVTRAAGAEGGLSLVARFSNTSASTVSDLTFQVAVTKVGASAAAAAQGTGVLTSAGPHAAAEAAERARHPAAAAQRRHAGDAAGGGRAGPGQRGQDALEGVVQGGGRGAAAAGRGSIAWRCVRTKWERRSRRGVGMREAGSVHGLGKRSIRRDMPTDACRGPRWEWLRKPNGTPRDRDGRGSGCSHRSQGLLAVPGEMLYQACTRVSQRTGCCFSPPRQEHRIACDDRRRRRRCSTDVVRPVGRARIAAWPGACGRRQAAAARGWSTAHGGLRCLVPRQAPIRPSRR